MCIYIYVVLFSIYIWSVCDDGSLFINTCAQGSKVPSKAIGPISDECVKDIDTPRGILTFFTYVLLEHGSYSRTIT